MANVRRSCGPVLTSRIINCVTGPPWDCCADMDDKKRMLNAPSPSLSTRDLFQDYFSGREQKASVDGWQVLVVLLLL